QWPTARSSSENNGRLGGAHAPLRCAGCTLRASTARVRAGPPLAVSTTLSWLNEYCNGSAEQARQRGLTAEDSSSMRRRLESRGSSTRIERSALGCERIHVAGAVTAPRGDLCRRQRSTQVEALRQVTAE